MEWLQLPLSWDWASIWKSAIGAGFGTAAVAGFLTLYRERRHRRSLAAYMAMRLAVILEAYASQCADAIGENSNAAHPPGQQYPDWNSKLPELPPFPDDAEGWRSIDRKLAGRCLNLRNKVHTSQGVIRSIIEYDMDTFEDTFNEYAAERGLEAWRLAVALREQHDIEQADVIWDYARQLGRMLEEAKRSQEKRSQAQAAYWADLAGDQDRINSALAKGTTDTRQ